MVNRSLPNNVFGRLPEQADSLEALNRRYDCKIAKLILSIFKMIIHSTNHTLDCTGSIVIHVIIYALVSGILLI